ncbi:MAG TPA: hypothetical protein VIY73_25000 [Polyangiaceae bacterium]
MPSAGCGGGTASVDGGARGSRPDAGQDSTTTTSPDAAGDVAADGARDAPDEVRSGASDGAESSDASGLDALEGAEAGQCPSTCTTASNCASCPVGFLTDYCCDPGAGGIGCYVYSPDVPCPARAPTGNCIDAGCATGQVCVTYVQGPDPPEIVPPACYLVPGACASDPTCGCEADAGLCSGGYTPDCSSGSIQCLAQGI